VSSHPRARAVVLPLATLGELLAYGFEVHVWCPRCHQWGGPTIPAERLRDRIAGTRFRCRCGAPGYPSFRSSPHAPKGRGDTITDLYCPHCLPPWEMRDVRLDQPPWSTVELEREPPTATPFAPWEHVSPDSKQKC
jgi:hypothetical protein